VISKHRTAVRVVLIAAGLFVASIVSVGPALFLTAAQNPANSRLFVQVDPSKADLTKTQEELLAQLKAQGISSDTQLVRIRTNLLTPSPWGLRINVAPGKQLEVMSTETRPRAEGFTWISKPDALNAPNDSAVLIVNDGNVTGTLRTGNELYALRPLGGGLHALIRQDQNKFPPEHPPEFKQKELEPPGEFMNSSTADVSDAPKVLRILVAYTPRVAAGQGDINAFINLAIAETNLSYTNSHVNIRAELAYAYQVNYQESGSHDTDLDHFRNKDDLIMDEVHDLRNTYRADVCVLLIDNNAYCGTASAILATESTAFVVVHHTCATGYYSFAHEIGHLQGARHNRDADSAIAPFPYGHGYFNEIGKWRTIMSYNCSAGCPRLPYWSNPNIPYNSDPMGSASDCDNARVLNETASTITSFRN
jgi:hypothetical protein